MCHVCVMCVSCVCVSVCVCHVCLRACDCESVRVCDVCVSVCHVCVHQVEQYITGAENTSVRLGMLMEVCNTQVKEICNNT